MSSGSLDDYGSAIWSAIGDTFKRCVLMVLAPLMGNFVGFNCFDAPRLVANFSSAGGWSGAAACIFDGVRSFGNSAASWPFALIMSFNHLATLLCLGVLAYAALRLWLAEENWLKWVAVLLVVQPLDTWVILWLENPPVAGVSLAISGGLLAAYEGLVIGGYVWHCRLYGSES